MTIATAPDVNGSNWNVDQPYTNKRYSFDAGEWVYVIRDVGCSWLWRLHARNKATGEVITFNRDVQPGQDGLDGLQALYGATVRRELGRMRPTDEWQMEAFPSLLDGIFAGLEA